MSLEIIFHGAAGAVTGSCMELRTATQRVLVDCGMFQGSRALEALNYEPLPFDPHEIDVIVLTHAHLDHSGRLPLLMREGCRARIWCTPPNRQLLGPLLTDAAKLQAADADRRNERPDRAALPRFEPLYDFADVEQVVTRIHGLDYGHLVEPWPGIQLRFWDAHHILGAASVELHIDGQSLLFSGDIGPEAPDGAEPIAPEGGWDHVICEATYGDRDRMILPPVGRREALATLVEEGLARGGNLIIPAFALERTQVLIEDLVELFASGRLKPSNVFVDAPLADKMTQAYRRFTPPKRGPSPFDDPHIHFPRSIDESKALNRMSGAIILAGSGMCTGGRVRYHLLRNLPRADSMVLFVGYQARGTLGAVLRAGAQAVRISGADVPVRARIVGLDAYSGHADHAALIRWLEKRAPVRGSLFLDHGEAPALARLAADAGSIPGLPRAVVPALGERFTLMPGAAPARSAPPRADADRLVSGKDWRSHEAALRAEIDTRLQALASDAERDAMLSEIDRVLGEPAAA